MNSRLSALVASVVCFTLVVGCSQEPSASEDGAVEEFPAVTLVNTICPMMGGPVDKAVSVEWNGQMVGFCCADCIPGWNELSDEEKAAKLAGADEKEAINHDHASPDAE